MLRTLSVPDQWVGVPSGLPMGETLDQEEDGSLELEESIQSLNCHRVYH